MKIMSKIAFAFNLYTYIYIFNMCVFIYKTLNQTQAVNKY